MAKDRSGWHLMQGSIACRAKHGRLSSGHQAPSPALPQVVAVPGEHASLCASGHPDGPPAHWSGSHEAATVPSLPSDIGTSKPAAIRDI